MNAITKRLLSFVIVLAMVLSMTPVITLPAAAATTTQMTAVETWHTAANGALKFADGGADVTISATCPACSPDTAVTWKPLTAAVGNLAAQEGGFHYYLPGNIDTNSKQFIRTASGNGETQRVCLYLNDKSIEIDGQMLIRCKFNVIAGPSTAEGANTITRADVDATGYNNGLFYLVNLYTTLSFYGGTYQNNYAGVPLIKTVYQGKVNIYDGTFNSVSSVISAEADDSSRANSTITMYDGTLTAGTGSAVVLNNSGDDFIMNGGSITGEVKAANTGATVTLAGAPTISGTGLVLGGVLANIDGLTADASIAVTGALGDKLSAASDNAANVANRFTVNTEGLVVAANADDQLEIVEYVAPFVPPETCPCCGVAGDQLEWTAISAPYEGKPWYVSSSGVTKHVYLAKDVTVPATYASVFMNAYNEGGCLYLNGKTLTYNGTGATVFRTAALPLTIFGDGNVINNGSGYMFDFNGAGNVNIYGGTYTHNGTDASKPMFENNALSGASTHAMIYGGTFNVNVGTYDEDNSYSNNNVQIADGYSVTNNGDGTYTVQEIVEQAVVCPGCGLEVLPSAWEVYTNQHLTAETALTEGTKHYKLTDNLTCGPYGLYMTGGTVCFDLNGHNINRSGAGAAFRMTAGTLNIFGEGIVTGSQYGTVRLDSASATANLKGGTYTKYTTASGGYRSAPILSLESGGTVNMYDGVTLTTAGKYNNGYGAAVALGGKSATAKSIFNMYGGTITFGDDVQNIQAAGTMGGLITVGRSSLSCWAEATITGGTINAVALENVLGDAIYVAPDKNCFLTVSGDAEINGEVWAGIDDGETVSTANINLAGTPTINGALVLNGAQINIAELAAGADIDVTAALNDVLTAEGVDATAVKDCFHLTGETELVIEVNDAKQLVVAASVPPVVLPTKCPGCGADLTADDWAALTEDPGSIIYSASSALDGKFHLYLANDITMAETRTNEFLRVYTAANCCLYLNGKTLTNNGSGNVFHARAYVLNIFGDGKVVNNSTASMFNYNGAGRINILGGEYEQNGTANMFNNGAFAAGSDDIIPDHHVYIYGGSFNADLSKDNPKYGSRYQACPMGVSVVNGNSETVYADGAAAVAAYNGGYIRANEDATLNITGETWIDNAGNVVTVTGDGTLYAMNSSGDDFATTSNYFLVGDDVEVVRDVTGGANGYRYIVVDGGSLEGERIVKPYRLALKLSAVTLRPALDANMGLYYKAAISCGPELASLLGAEGNAYGVVLSLQDMPGTNFMTEINPENSKPTNAYTEIEGQVLDVNAENNWTAVLNSGSVFNIMKADTEKIAANKISGEMPIYANAYLSIKFTDDGAYEYIMADTVNGNTTNGVKYSLYDVLHAINQKWASYADYHESLNNFYTYWYDFGMSAWEDELTNFTKKNG